VDGTLIEAWASVKSFTPKDEGGPGDDDDAGAVASQKEQAATPTDRNAGRDFRGEKRSNATHASTTDPDARLFKKARGQAAKLCHMAHVLMENRNGLVVDTILTHSTGTVEREAALTMLGPMDGRHRITLGADKIASDGPSRSPLPPTTSADCRNCWLRPNRAAHITKTAPTPQATPNLSLE
jgi:hypothetical protein